MSKIGLKDPKMKRLIGRAIFDSWQDAINDASKTDYEADAAENDPGTDAAKNDFKTPKINRELLIQKLGELLDVSFKGKTEKTIEFDVVFDTDLDRNTRLVWLSIPTPDVDAQGMDDTWEKWKKTYYDDLTPAEKEKKEEELGGAVLFGCGR